MRRIVVGGLVLALTSGAEAACEVDQRAADIMAAKHGQYELWAAQTIAKQELQLKALLAEVERLKKAADKKTDKPSAGEGTGVPKEGTP